MLPTPITDAVITSEIGTSTLATTPVIQVNRAAGREAYPGQPPIKACEDEEGRPNYQVMKFQGDCSYESREKTSISSAAEG